MAARRAYMRSRRFEKGAPQDLQTLALDCSYDSGYHQTTDRILGLPLARHAACLLSIADSAAVRKDTTKDLQLTVTSINNWGPPSIWVSRHQVHHPALGITVRCQGKMPLASLRTLQPTSRRRPNKARLKCRHASKYACRLVKTAAKHPPTKDPPASSCYTYDRRAPQWQDAEAQATYANGHSLSILGAGMLWKQGLTRILKNVI